MTAPLSHTHDFLGDQHRQNARKVWLVIALTSVTMVLEIIAGSLFGSMALVADGWHMSTHAAAMLIAAIAYAFARRHSNDPAFSFGTGKLGDLAAFASAVLLALVAALIGWESLHRLAQPVPIDFRQAMVVAAIGLAVNLLSAWVLKDDHHHGHHHHEHHEHHEHHDHHDHEHHDHDDHDHQHHAHHGHDNNLRAAYLHVVADALTSVLAIAALLVGQVTGWVWADPLMGIIGALVICHWSWSLIRTTGAILLDSASTEDTLPAAIRHSLEGDETRITDLHVWQVGPGHHAAIIALSSPAPQAPSHYKQKLAHLGGLSHVTVECNPA